MLFDLGARWKTLLLEASADEVWKIGVHLNEIIESRSSSVQLAYKHSLGARLAPAIAAAKIFSYTTQNTKLFKNQSKNTFLSKILRSNWNGT